MAQAWRSHDDESAPAWLRLVEGVALTKLAASVFVTAIVQVDSPLETVNRVAHVLLFGGVGVALRLLGGRDHRAHALGHFLILTATAWADPLLSVGRSATSPLSLLCTAFLSAQVVALAPYVFWLFVRDFPRRRVFYRRGAVITGMRTALLSGVLLLACNAVLPLWADRPGAPVLQWFARDRLDGLFWPVIFLTSVPAMIYAVGQAHRATTDERRRVAIMTSVILLGLFPEVLLTLLSIVNSAVRDYLTSDRGRVVLFAMVSIPELSIPFGVAYAVLVHRALDLRLIVRRVLQYGLARTTLALLMVLPLVGLLFALYENRGKPMVELLSGPTGLLLLGLAGAAGVAAFFRPALLAKLDRRFFREQYDARVILGHLVESARSLEDPRQLAVIVPREIDRALHVESVTLFLLDQARNTLVAPAGATSVLPATSRLVHLLRERGQVDVEALGATRPRPRDLPEDEWQWLAETGASQLVAIRSRTGDVIGTIALGEKRSGLPYSVDDMHLLRAIGAAIGLAVAYQESGHQSMVGLQGGGTLARECVACGMVVDEACRACPVCGKNVAESRVPALLAGKFRALKRLGQGSMGVVYLALDETLGREVALKALPRGTATRAFRLRREARALAAVSHENLELIHGTEAWRGSPILVVEFVPAGTLEDQLSRRGALPWPTALAFASELASALSTVHAAGLLHRDIKPSNIGFTEQGRVKLLDFGLATILEGELTPTGVFTVQEELGEPLTETGEILGTLPYLSPEILAGGRPSPAMDLWALSVVLFQAISGRHPFLPGSRYEVMARIHAAEFPDIRALAPDVPDSLAQLLRDCLQRDPKARPGTASEWQARAKSLLPMATPG